LEFYQDKERDLQGAIYHLVWLQITFICFILLSLL
jgi:hypothetical protein